MEEKTVPDMILVTILQMDDYFQMEVNYLNIIILNSIALKNCFNLYTIHASYSFSSFQGVDVRFKTQQMPHFDCY